MMCANDAYQKFQIWDVRSGGTFDTIKYDHGVTALQFDTRKVVAAAGENGIKVSKSISHGKPPVKDHFDLHLVCNRYIIVPRCNIRRSQPTAIPDPSSSYDTWIGTSSQVVATPRSRFGRFEIALLACFMCPINCLGTMDYFLGVKGDK